MPIKEGLNDATLYLVDTETGERSIFNGISEIDTVSEAQNLITEEEKWGDSDKRIISCDIAKCDSETAVFRIKNFSMRDAYLRCLKDGVDVFWIPNNFRRMHGYKVRRCSLKNRRAMKASKRLWKKQKAQ